MLNISKDCINGIIWVILFSWIPITAIGWSIASIISAFHKPETENNDSEKETKDDES